MQNTLSKNSIKGVFVPLVTPMRYGEFDKESMAQLMQSIEQYVDGYVPCLSTGEGNVLTNDQWYEVVSFVRSMTDKPVIAGIKRDSKNEIIELAKKAKELGCDSFITPVPSNNWEETRNHFIEISESTNLPFMVYNTEAANISSVEHLMELDQLESVIALKDSSLNTQFFTEACNLRAENRVGLSVLQGMEHLLEVPEGCDGYLVSMANIEPELIRSMYENPSKEINYRILQKFMEYNLGAEWYVSLKALLYYKGIIRSSEQVQQFVHLENEVVQEIRELKQWKNIEYTIPRR